MSYYVNRYNWLVKEEPKPLNYKELRIPLFPHKVLSCGDIKLCLYRKPLKNKLKIKSGWIEFSSLTDEDSDFIGSILLGGTQIGSIDNLSHDGECTLLETIFIEEQYRRNNYCTCIIELLLEHAKERGSKKFIIREIITEKEGLEYTRNPLIFKRVARLLITKKLIKSFYFDSSSLNSNRLNLIMEVI